MRVIIAALMLLVLAGGVDAATVTWNTSNPTVGQTVVFSFVVNQSEADSIGNGYVVVQLQNGSNSVFSQTYNATAVSGPGTYTVSFMTSYSAVGVYNLRVNPQAGSQYGWAASPGQVTIDSTGGGNGTPGGGGGGGDGEGFTLSVSDECPEPGDTISIDVESSDPRIVGYRILIYYGGTDDPITGEITGQDGSVPWEVGTGAGDKVPIVAKALDANGQIVATRSVNITIGDGGCGEVTDDDPGGDPAEPEEESQQCLADVDCYCRGIKSDDGFWMSLLKRGFVPCKCRNRLGEGGATAFDETIPMCRVYAQVEALVGWGPFGFVADLVGLKDIEAAEAVPVGIAVPAVDPVSGNMVLGTTVNLNFSTITDLTGWGVIRGIMGVAVYVGFALMLADKLMPKQTV